MTSTIKKNIAIAVTVLLILGFLSIFTVNEGESAFILRLGKIVNNAQTDQPAAQRPGLHGKIPLLDRVRYFDMRMQQLATPALHPLTVVTKEQTYLLVEYFAKWRINNLSKFYTSTGGSVSWAETLLEQRINDIVRAEYGRRTSIQAISTDRTNMMTVIREQANNIGKDQGISVADVRIQQITLPKDVMDSVFKRMATERKQFAEAKRAGGMEKSEEIRALADQEVTVIKAKAWMQGATVRAKGEQEAAEMYAKIYGANPVFYAFYRSLEAYENSFRDKNDILVLKPEGSFFAYFHGIPSNSNFIPRNKSRAP
jgi:membrane protease subunit HflC